MSWTSSLFLLPFLCFLSTTTIAATASPIPDCPSTNCGHFNISYPFSLAQDEPNSSPSLCGYPNLLLRCANQTPVISLSDHNYTVNNISYTLHTFSLTDDDILQDPNTCPRVHHNLTLDANSLLATTASDSNLNFFFNCSGISGMTPITCLGSNHSFSYVFPDDGIPPNVAWSEVCGEVVVVQALHSAVLENLNSLFDSFGRILRQGFELHWNAAANNDCLNCENSGGLCGATNAPDSAQSDFVCHCSDGIHGLDCSDGGRISESESSRGTWKKVAVGVSAGVAFILAVCLVYFLYKRRKGQQQSASSTLLYRSASSELSSKKDHELGGANYQTHIFSYDELQEATNFFDTSKELGDGGFGTVYKGKLRDGRIVAVKRLYESNYKRVEQFMNEVDILSRLRHQNLVTLYGCTSRHSRELLLVYEFVPNGTVADHLHGPRAVEGGLTWPIRMNIAIETADALAYLHAVEPQIIHRDVKTNNILLDNGFHVKVADFGLSRLFPLDATHVSTAPQGTPGYVDPEYHQCYQLTDKSDVYSFGVVLVELISSMPAVDISRHRHEINLANMAVNKIQNQELDQLVDQGLGYHSDFEVKRMITQVAELAFRCLQLEREMRPCIKEVLAVLRGIESGDERRIEIGDERGIESSDEHKAEKGGETDVPTKEESRLLKNFPPYSPDSVADRWESISTTPNASG